MASHMIQKLSQQEIIIINHYHQIKVPGQIKIWEIIHAVVNLCGKIMQLATT